MLFFPKFLVKLGTLKLIIFHPLSNKTDISYNNYYWKNDTNAGSHEITGSGVNLSNQEEKGS
jgi:hypothetical protein